MAQTPACTVNTLNHLGAGCEQLDKIFTNFSLTNNNGPNASLIGTAFTGTSETGGVTASFLATWVAADLGSPATTHATIGYDLQVDTSILPPDPTEQWAITGLSLSQAGALALFSGASVQIFENFCLGSTTFNCNSSSGNFGYIEYNQVAGSTTTDSICFNDGGSSCTVSNGSLTLNLTGPGTAYPVGVEQVAIQDVLTLSAPALLRSANLNDVGNTFTESAVPEPGTSSLAAFVLSGFAVLAWRRSRRRLTSAAHAVLLHRDGHS